jgi:hypothetical protein
MTRTIARVFLDTTLLKAAKDSDIVFVPRQQSVRWGATQVDVVVHDMAFANQNVAYLRNNRDAFNNRLHNRFVARFAKDGHNELLLSEEVLFEAMGLPRVDFSFYGAPRTVVGSPVPHGGLVLDASRNDYLFDALRSIESRRFRELQKLTGAFQGNSNSPNRNQLLDAFHLWCAECAGADYFLTHDTKLVDVWSRSSYARSCRPIDTVPLIRKLFSKRPSLVLPFFSEAWKIRKSRRNLFTRYQKCDGIVDQ